MPPPLHLGATTRRACWCVRVRAVVRSERRRSSGSARHTHRPARPSRLRRWEARHGATRGAAEHPPRAAGEGVARSKLVVHQRLGGRARPPACAQRRAGCSSQAAQADGCQAGGKCGAGSNGREATSSARWTAVSTDTTRARRIDRCCSPCGRCVRRAPNGGVSSSARVPAVRRRDQAAPLSRS